ncbi:MAG: exopolyphosphatase [Flavobacteriaceae bacterium]|nr:exopolyphosphatase [Bacteroidia bacterium]NNK87859.1 exopolyphosphatase [Flavobacteriaceae bacterium]
MLTIKKLAAIDIGSNAIRLMIADVIEQHDKSPIFRKSSLVRVPIRLGADVFSMGEISPQNRVRMQDTMLAFKLLMRAHGIDQYKACATSAMREAENGSAVVENIKNRSGVEIDIIDGEEEATIIAATDISKYIDTDKTYLYVDVGGGSTEFTIIHHGDKKRSQSFKIGTVRLLKDLVTIDVWDKAQKWIRKYTKDYERIAVIGSGGNINKIFKISGKPLGEPLTYFYLTSFYEKLRRYSYEERIVDLELKQDRADVIEHATRIYLSAMKWSGAEHIYVPKIGLSDGIIKSLYYGFIEGRSIAELHQP